MKVNVKQIEKRKNYLDTILYGRGITDIQEFLNPDKNSLQDYKYLTNIEQGVDIIRTVKSGIKHISLIVDSDADGYTSAAIIYQYLMRLNPNLNINWYVHENKQHGMEDAHLYIEGVNDLIIVPDAGSNDGIYAENYQCPILILDHHILEDNSQADNMIIVNNQNSPDYHNKGLTGAGVVYQFCRALDDAFGNEWADDYIDLAALGICADMGSGLSYENQFLWREGFRNIQNLFFQKLVEKQSFKLQGRVTPLGISFYIAPLINAMIRSGTYEEKQRMFLALVKGEEWIRSNKRGAKGALEQRAIESVRECTNAKSRQDKEKIKFVEVLSKKIAKDDLLAYPVLLIELTDKEQFSRELNGLIANQLANQYKRPTLILRRNKDGFLQGSTRGLNGSELLSFKDFMDESGLFEYTAGHPNACGASLHESNKQAFLNYADEELSDIDISEEYYNVDFSFCGDDAELKTAMDELSNESFIWSQDCSEPLLYIHDLQLSPDDWKVVGKQHNTLQIQKHGVQYVMFKADDAIEALNLCKFAKVNIVGIPTFNDYSNSPQLRIQNLEVSNNFLDF